MRLLPNSNVVNLYYDEKRFYSVGTITENSEVKYVCYAVKGEYGFAPPELKRYCRFIPLSPLFTLKEGYFVIFQSATSGEILTF